MSAVPSAWDDEQMSGPADELWANVRRMEAEWRATSKGWRDQSAVHFERDRWSQLVQESRDVATAAQQLTDVLEKAKSVARK